MNVVVWAARDGLLEKRILDHLRTRNQQVCLLGTAARVSSGVGVLVVSSGRFCSSHLRVLPPREKDGGVRKRLADIARRGFSIPEHLLTADAVVVVRQSSQASELPAGNVPTGLQQALDNLCGIKPPKKLRGSRGQCYLAKRKERRVARLEEMGLAPPYVSAQ